MGQGDSTTTVETRQWRTLIRVVDIYDQAGYIEVLIPAWDVNETVRVSIADLPTGVLDGFPVRLHAKSKEK